MKLKKHFSSSYFHVFLKFELAIIVMLSRLTLSAEQEIILPLMIKIKRYSCLVQDQWSKITHVYSTGTDLEQYNMKNIHVRL